MTTLNRTLPPYTPFEEALPLGKGGYGIVKRGKQLVTESPVALKAQSRTEISQREAAVSEMITKAGIPHCLRYRDSYHRVLKGKDVQVIITDLVGGKDLHRTLQEATMLPTLHDCSIIMKSIFECLVGFEKEKFAHFDLKPGNIIYDPETKRVLILDFGSTIKYDEMPTTHRTETDPYRSPESLLGCPVKDGKCLVDAWSAGCILYELYTGEKLIPHPGPELSPTGRINFLLQHIAAVIGTPPPPDLVQSSPFAKEFFTDNFHFKNPDPKIQPLDWKAKIKASIEEDKLSEMEYNDIIEVLNHTLQYPDLRAHPEQLLEDAFCYYNIGFKVELGSYKDQKLPARLRMMPKFKFDENFEDISIRLDLNQRLGCRCYHLERDSDDQYVVIIETANHRVCRTVTLENDVVLDLVPLIQDVFQQAVPKQARRNLKETF